MDILSAANLKTGTMSYKMAPYDLKQSIIDIAGSLEPDAIKKRCQF